VHWHVLAHITHYGTHGHVPMPMACITMAIIIIRLHGNKWNE